MKSNKQPLAELILPVDAANVRLAAKRFAQCYEILMRDNKPKLAKECWRHQTMLFELSQRIDLLHEDPMEPKEKSLLPEMESSKSECVQSTSGKREGNGNGV